MGINDVDNNNINKMGSLTKFEGFEVINSKKENRRYELRKRRKIDVISVDQLNIFYKCYLGCGKPLCELRYYIQANEYIVGKKCTRCGNNYFYMKDIKKMNPNMYNLTRKITSEIKTIDKKRKYVFKYIDMREGVRNKQYSIVNIKTAFCPECNTQLEHWNIKGEPYAYCTKCKEYKVTYAEHIKIRNYKEEGYKCSNLEEYLLSNEAINMKKKEAEISQTKIQKPQSAIVEKYCMCELRDSNFITTKITIANKSINKNDGVLGKVIAVTSTLGIACLEAVANDQQNFTVGDKKYKIIRSVVYDYSVVNSFTYRKSELTKKEKLQNSLSIEKQSVKRDADKTSIYVYFKLNNICTRNNHNVESVTFETSNLYNNKKVSVNAYHCRQCGKYWINYDAMQKMFNRNIYPRLHYFIVDDSWGTLKPASLLMMYGYNVKAGGLTDAQRHRLLQNIIDLKLMRKNEIIANIQSKVDFNGKKVGNERAKEKWKDDIEFVSQYVSDNAKQVHGNLRR